MALWLQRQEAIHLKSCYLDWKQQKRSVDSGGGISGPVAESEMRGLGMDVSDLAAQQSSGIVFFLVSVCFLIFFTAVEVHYKVAKQPSRRRLTVEQLNTEYKAIDFLRALGEFLASRSSPNRVVQPVQIDRFDVYKQVSIMVGRSTITGHDQSKLKVRARPDVAAHGHKASTPGQFDTVFILEDGYWCTSAFTSNSTCDVFAIVPASLIVTFDFQMCTSLRSESFSNFLIILGPIRTLSPMSNGSQHCTIET